MRFIDHLIGGGPGGSAARKFSVRTPSTGQVQAEVALGDAALLDKAVQAALTAQPAWAATNPQRRARVMFEFQRLVEANMQELWARICSASASPNPWRITAMPGRPYARIAANPSPIPNPMA